MIERREGNGADGGRAIASTPYDTAWVATVPRTIERRDPRFPSALNWICANQLPDGSWGSDIAYIHDRILCTLAALIPLKRFGRRDGDLEQVERGERYLWKNSHLLEREPCELVGFELLLPTLVEMARDAGVNVPPHLGAAFERERSEKLGMLPSHLLYSRHVTIAHSLEFLGSDVNPLQLLEVRAPNGSIGNSPAATAFLLHHIEDAGAVAYLEQCLADDGGGVSVLDPCETYEALWSAYHRWLGGVPAAQLISGAFRDELASALEGDGVSLSPSFPVPDADETAVALMLFHEAGIPAPLHALQGFERDDYFVSFPFERHSSTGVNIHALQALIRYPTYPNRERAIQKVLDFLTRERRVGSYWLDKWHISPYYATGRAVIALSELADQGAHDPGPLLEPAVAWMLHTQNENGSWGFFDTPTAEESAYALLALERVANRYGGVRDAIARGRAWLDREETSPRPALWIDKCLYYPTRIVDAAIEAARAPLHAAERRE